MPGWNNSYHINQNYKALAILMLYRDTFQRWNKNYELEQAHVWYQIYWLEEELLLRGY